MPLPRSPVISSGKGGSMSASWPGSTNFSSNTPISTTGGSMINNIITSGGTCTTTTTSISTNWVDSSNYDWVVQSGRQQSISRRQRIIIQGLRTDLLLPSDKAIDASQPVKLLLDEMFDTLTPHGIDEMNKITKQINFINLNEVDFKGLIKMKDHTLLRIHDDGNFEIHDGAAQTIYKSNRIKDFNKYIEGSSLLEDFIKDCGTAGIRQSEFMSIPIEVFIHWLIYKAALKDDDPLPNGVYAPENHPETKKMKLPRCLACGKFISPAFTEAGINFCNEVCMIVMRNHKAPLLKIS